MTERAYVAPNKSIYLVQRIYEREGKPNPQKKGIDRCFCMDYMGSSEFEFGALPQALAAWRVRGINHEPKHMRLSNRTGARISVSYVGPDEYVEAVTDFIQKQIYEPYGVSLKERTEIQDVLSPDAGEEEPETIGWWDIENNWVVFTKAKFAHQWIEALKGGVK